MTDKAQKQLATMVDAVQPYCAEKIVVAMTCSHAGSMGSALASSLLGGIGGGGKSCSLPNPVFIAVGQDSIYAFDYKPKGFKFKIKREVARWRRDEVTVEAEPTGTMAEFVLTSSSGEAFPLEIPTFMGGRDLADTFLAALGESQDQSQA